MRILSIATKIVVSVWLATIIHELGHAGAGMVCGVPIREINFGEYPFSEEQEKKHESLIEAIASWSFKIRIERELTKSEWDEYLASDDTDKDLPSRTPIRIVFTPLLIPLGGYVFFEPEAADEIPRLKDILITLAGPITNLIGAILLLRFSSSLSFGLFWRQIGGIFLELGKIPIPFFSVKARRKRRRPGPFTVIAVAIRDEETNHYPWLRFVAVISLVFGLVELLPFPEGDSEDLIRLCLKDLVSGNGFDVYFSVMTIVGAVLGGYLLVLQVWSWLAGPARKEEGC